MTPSSQITIQKEEPRPAGRGFFSFLQEGKGIPGSVLKILAVISMLIDHFAAGVIRYGILAYYNSIGNAELYNKWVTVYKVCRRIGRPAFPIFCFLLVEGCMHTRDMKKYGLRLLVFAFLSEIPFDLGLETSFFELEHQNVFFTLFLGWLMIWIISESEKRFRIEAMSAVRVAAAVGCAFAAEVLNTDYGAYGILIISLFYFLYGQKKIYVPLVGVTLLYPLAEIPASLAVVPIWFYNGKRGRQIKYLFYLIYPCHLLLYYLAEQLLIRAAV